MFETLELALFFRQLGLALAGASAFWGLFFVWQSYRRDESTTSSIMYEWTARQLRIPFFGGFLLSTMSWLAIELVPLVHAHEGVRIVPSVEEVFAGMDMLGPVYIIWTALLLGALLSRRTSYDVVSKNLGWFYSIQLMIIFLLITFTGIGDYTSSEWAFFMFHGFHSIFTLGTVLVLDFLFLGVQKSVVGQQHLFPFFPAISKVVWVGLALDLFSVLLVYPEAFVIEPRFFFAQTVVGVLIMNGILLSGVIARKMHSAVMEPDGQPLTNHWKTFANVAGAISVTSWTAITFVDFFTHIALSYTQMIAIYLLVIVFLYIAHEIHDRVAYNTVPV